MNGAIAPFQLDLRDSEAKRTYLYLYAEEKKEIYAQFLGLTRCKGFRRCRPYCLSLKGYRGMWQNVETD